MKLTLCIGSRLPREVGPTNRSATPLANTTAVVRTTAVVFASGVALLFVGPTSRGSLLPIHKVSFVLWLGLTALHVIGHLPGLGNTLRADYGRPPGSTGAVAGRDGRMLAMAGALAAGAVLAILVLPEFGAWLHASNLFHRDG